MRTRNGASVDVGPKSRVLVDGSTRPEAAPHRASVTLLSKGKTMAKQTEPLLAVPHVPPHVIEWVCNVLKGTLDDKLSPGYPPTLTGLVLSFDGSNDKVILKGTVDGDPLMVYVDGDDIGQLVTYIEDKTERGKLRWSIDRYAKK